jgi:hypothetical protein
MIRWTQVTGFLTENGETKARAALDRLDIARLNEVVVIFTGFIKGVEGNFISYFDIFLMFQKLLVNLGSLLAGKHAETLMLTAECFSRTTDLNVIFFCCRVTPAEKNNKALLSDQASSR